MVKMTILFTERLTRSNFLETVLFWTLTSAAILNKLVVLQLFCAQELRHANRMKTVGFSAQFGLAKLCLKVKSKMSFFSERLNYFKKKKYSLFAFNICKRRVNLSFLALPKKLYFV